MSEVQWVSTLDGSTCIECASLDGETFPIESGARPPDHPSCRCLRPETPIQTPGGPVPIEYIVPGDTVRTHAGRYRPVLRRIRTVAPKLMAVALSNGTTIRATPEHLFLLLGGTWAEAEKLSPGQFLTKGDSSLPQREHEHSNISVMGVALEQCSPPAIVYDLEVELDHTYIAGGVVVHNCTTVPVVKSWRELGFRKDELAPSTRASIDGQVSETLSYGDFLRKQDAAFQDEMLGPTRGALFREGKLSVKDFVDDNHNTMTLAELKRAEPRAFSRAGLDEE
jgi:hypothetical protein